MYFTTYSIQHLLIFPAITFSVPSISPLSVLPWETGILIHAAERRGIESVTLKKPALTIALVDTAALEGE